MTTILGGASNSDSNNILMAMLIILIVIGIAYFIYYLYVQNNLIKSNNNNQNVNNDTNYEMEEETHIPVKNTQMHNRSNNHDKKIIESFDNPPSKKLNMNSNMHSSMNSNSDMSNDKVCFPKEQLTADELLPTDNSSLWAQINPSGEGSFKDKNFLQSGYHIGINTVGQTLRNANLQLRSEPPCPQVKVSPWLQATIEPDLGRKPFEIGGCA
jgi:hypothetical protein